MIENVKKRRLFREKYNPEKTGKLKKEKNYEKIWNGIKGKSDGFTFIETMAVLAIGAILSAGCIFSASKIISFAKKSSAKNQIQQYCSALQIYFLDCNRFPTTEQGLSALWEKPVLYPVPENWNGPYIDSEPSPDPWGEYFKYFSGESGPLPENCPENLPFVIYSYGKDKKKGGKGDNSDIFSWK